ncbi:MAG: hypothetical protein GIX02_06970 [Candidatus Eremiobacteraeota bacterium]|nr:hypothetical protein [Candidatus Eremiobacteraeota bacterium]
MDRPDADQRARRPECPPDLRPTLKDALAFLAGLIRGFGLPARLSFGGAEPARDGTQITIDIRSLRRSAQGTAHDWHQRGDDQREDELAILIGKHGATLDALSAITNAAMRNDDCRDVFFSVDIEGYRARRAATLRSIAQRCAERVLREGHALELEPMPASERRIIHMALANSRDLATESTGFGSERRVVILPRKARVRPHYSD